MKGEEGNGEEKTVKRSRAQREEVMELGYVLTHCGCVGGTERGSGGQGGGALCPGEGSSQRKTGVGQRLGRAERPYLVRPHKHRNVTNSNGYGK